MEMQCIQCLQLKEETSSQYVKRTRFNLDEPFYCQACRKHKIPYEEILFKRALPQAIEDKKAEIKTLITRYKQNKKLQENRKALLNELKALKREKAKIYATTDHGKEVIKKGDVKRRLTLKQAMKGIPKHELDMVKTFYDNRPIGYEVDHIIPISKGGKHRLDNLRYVLAEDHRSKFNKIDPKYIEYALENEKISISTIQRKFMLDREAAEKIYLEIKEVL